MPGEAAGRRHRLDIPNRGAAAAGFTLVEILVVLVVLALATGVALANLSTLQQRARLESETRELTAFLLSVPDHARELHAPAYLHWDATSRRLDISSDAAGSDVVDHHLVPEEISIGTTLPALLRCDTVSRAYVGTSPSMMSTVQTLDLEHVGATSSLRVSYRLILSPLWSVVAEKRVE